MKPITWVAVRQIDLKVAARLGDPGADRDVLELMAVVVEKRLALVNSVLPACDDRANLPLGAVEHGLDAGVGRCRSELIEQSVEPALTDAR